MGDHENELDNIHEHHGNNRQDECCSSRFGCAVLVLRGDKGESLWPGLVKEQPVDLQRRRYVRVWSLHEKTSQLFC